MKKALALLLTCTMALGLTACGSTGSKSQWSDADLTFTVDGEELTVEEGTSFIVYEDESYLTTYADGEYEAFGEGVTSRGLELGMGMDDVKKLYTVVKGYAVWELYSGDDNAYTSFTEYTNQDASDLYADSNNVWLDLGFYKDGDSWKVLKDYEVQNVWFCDADYDDYDEVVVFAINFDTLGQVVGISLEHFTYDEGWTEWQGWAE